MDGRVVKRYCRSRSLGRCWGYERALYLRNFFCWWMGRTADFSQQGLVIRFGSNAFVKRWKRNGLWLWWSAKLSNAELAGRFLRKICWWGVKVRGRKVCGQAWSEAVVRWTSGASQRRRKLLINRHVNFQGWESRGNFLFGLCGSEVFRGRGNRGSQGVENTSAKAECGLRHQRGGHDGVETDGLGGEDRGVSCDWPTSGRPRDDGAWLGVCVCYVTMAHNTLARPLAEAFGQ